MHLLAQKPATAAISDTQQSCSTNSEIVSSDFLSRDVLPLLRPLGTGSLMRSSPQLSIQPKRRLAAISECEHNVPDAEIDLELQEEQEALRKWAWNVSRFAHGGKTQIGNRDTIDSRNTFIWQQFSANDTLRSVLSALRPGW